ncbi:hypothetical protein I553_5312 [Mycobacterium xenopi 4042]|uniref:Uncharacterized protein n=1 Tax=Mycobacterium xenopi 4042 TaxID=1299334 RepID=X7ZWX8_MYCXE|nr:hypothetical protein I553_5312 [Mycobacterium xenopi 4042]
MDREQVMGKPLAKLSRSVKSIWESATETVMAYTIAPGVYLAASG